MENPIIKYFARIGIAVSILANVILFGKLYQSFSARNYDWKRRGLPHLVPLIDLIFFFHKDHCLMCWISWVTRFDVVKDHETLLKMKEKIKDGEEKGWQEQGLYLPR